MPPQLRDSSGRFAADLRLSVTDRCNLRCRYCIPEEPEQWLARSEILSYEEMVRLTGVLAELGVRKVRLTGGEPLLRRDLPHLIAMLYAVPGIEQVTLTTNGLRLAGQVTALAAAGLRRINVSLDTLRPERFAQITQRDEHERALAGLHAARACGMKPVKVNAVAMRGFNDDEFVDFAVRARTDGWHVRFIEYMPIESGPGQWSRERVVGGDEILHKIGQAFALERRSAADDPGPATVYRFADGAPGSIGVITSVTMPFCKRCTRVRLSADGRFRVCLFAPTDVDIRGPLRDGADSDELAALFLEAVAAKGPGGCEEIHATGKALPLSRTMHQIGG